MSPSFRLGLLVILVAASCAVNLSGAAGPAVLGLLAVAAVGVARVPSRVILWRLAPLLSFCALTFLLALLAPVRPGTPAVCVPVLDRPVSRQGLQFATSLAVKSVLTVLFTTAVVSGLTERDFLAGLTGLGLPARVVALVYLMVRGLHTVKAEVRRLIRGRDSRGKPRGIRAVRVAGAMAQVLVVRLGRRAETQAVAMASRGYRGRIAPSQWRALSVAEAALLAVCGAVLMCVARM